MACLLLTLPDYALACTMALPEQFEQEYEIEIEYEDYDEDRDRITYKVEIEIEGFSSTQPMQCQCALNLGNTTLPAPTSFKVTRAIVGIRGDEDVDFEAFKGFVRDQNVESNLKDLDEFITGASVFGFSLDVAPFSFPSLQGENVFALAFEIELDPDDYDQVNGTPIQFAAGSADPSHPLSIFAGYQATLALPAPTGNLPVTGDFNEDRRVTAEDVDLICSRVARGDDDREFDVNRDGTINGDDVAAVLSIAGVLAGDIDFDGSVEFADFLTLSANFGNDGNYSSGDLDCSGHVDFADFLTLSSNFGLSSATAAVPEPTGGAWVTCGLWSCCHLLRRRRSLCRDSDHKP